MADRHKWADVIIAWANGEDIQTSANGRPFRDFTGAQPNFEAEDIEYRIKPRTIMIGDMEIPSPLQEAPSDNTKYWTVSFFDEYSLVVGRFWCGSGNDIAFLRHGLIHLDRDSAIDHARALITISGGTE